MIPAPNKMFKEKSFQNSNIIEENLLNRMPTPRKKSTFFSKSPLCRIS